MPIDDTKVVPLKTFENATDRAETFCKERNWEKFHKPPSIAMALSGRESYFDTMRIVFLTVGVYSR